MRHLPGAAVRILHGLLLLRLAGARVLVLQLVEQGIALLLRLVHVEGALAGRDQELQGGDEGVEAEDVQDGPRAALAPDARRRGADLRLASGVDRGRYLRRVVKGGRLPGDWQ